MSYLGKSRFALQTLEIGKEVLPNNVEITAKYVHLLLLSNIGGSALEESVLKLRDALRSLNLDAPLRHVIDCALSHYELKEGVTLWWERICWCVALRLGKHLKRPIC